SGDDPLTLPMMAIGGHGVITATANVIPGRMAAMVRAAMEGDWLEARRVHYEMAPLWEAMFLETNPIPVKTACAMMGKMEEEFRLPLCPMANMNREKLQMALKKAEII
ncbi:MAG: dihydrodipicolinate synthase family protein, partial [Nitrospinota bacterium]|nr:dihydrodipicolinate synthase family protein [Nitrospinota bacterium]